MIGVVVVEVDDGVEGIEQRQHGRVTHQRHLVAGHLDRHPSGSQRTPQRREHGATGSHQHRHVGPVDAVLEVSAAEQVGQVLGLGPLGVEGVHGDLAQAHRALRCLGCGEGLFGAGWDRAGQGQTTRDALRGEEQMSAEAPGGAQGDHVGRSAVALRELGWEVEDAAHLGTAEAVDRLMRIADRHQVAAVSGELGQQSHLTGIGVLVFVDEHVLVGGPQLVAMIGRLDRGPADQVGVVGGPVIVEVVEVLLQEQPGCDELRQVLGSSELGQLTAVEAFLPGSGQHGVHFAGEPSGAHRATQGFGPVDRLGVVGQEFTQHHVLLRGREQSQRRGVELGRGEPAYEPISEGVEGRSHGGGQRASKPSGHPITQLLGGLAGEGQRQHLVGPRSALLDPVDDRLHQCGGLASSGTGQHQQRPAAVIDHGLLVRIQRRHQDRRRSAHEAVGGGRRTHRGHPITRCRQPTTVCDGSGAPAPNTDTAQARHLRR